MLLSNIPFAKKGDIFRGHEFHYATITYEGTVNQIFECHNTLGHSLGSFGCQKGSISGSFIHLIDHHP